MVNLISDENIERIFAILFSNIANIKENMVDQNRDHETGKEIEVLVNYKQKGRPRNK